MWFFIASFKQHRILSVSSSFHFCVTFGLTNRIKSSEYAYYCGWQSEDKSKSGYDHWSVCKTLKYESKSTLRRLSHTFISILIACFAKQNENKRNRNDFYYAIHNFSLFINKIHLIHWLLIINSSLILLGIQPSRRKKLQTHFDIASRVRY